jgi:hypothetical protein
MLAMTSPRVEHPPSTEDACGISLHFRSEIETAQIAKTFGAPRQLVICKSQSFGYRSTAQIFYHRNPALRGIFQLPLDDRLVP